MFQIKAGSRFRLTERGENIRVTEVSATARGSSVRVLVTFEVDTGSPSMMMDVEQFAEFLDEERAQQLKSRR